MITDAIISAFLGLITSLLTLIPSLNLPVAPNLSATYIGQYAAAFNRIIPLELFITCIVGSFAMQLALWAFDGVLWIYHQIHGSD